MSTNWNIGSALYKSPRIGTLSVAIFSLVVICEKACIALCPVILARRVRYGGPARLAEFAALCVGLENLNHNLVQFLVFEVHASDPSWNWLRLMWRVPVYEWWSWVQL